MDPGGFLRRSCFWTKDFLRGQPVRRQYRDIEYILACRERGEERVRRCLTDLLHHAADSTLFYSAYAGCSLSEYPVVDKMMMRDNPAFNSSYFSDKVCRVKMTSGSTCYSLSVRQDIRKSARSLAEIKLFGERCGYASHERMAQFRAYERKNKRTALTLFMQNMLIISVAGMREDKMREIKKILTDKKVRAILAYASTLKIFAEWLENNNSPEDNFYIKVVISGAEALDDITRTRLEKIFGCNVIERYANEENGILAQQMPGDKRYYLNHASYLFETLKFENDENAGFGNLGRIVITDLFNYATPMIRYDTGDVGIMLSGDDTSGGWPILGELYGRRIDVIYDTLGYPVSPHAIERNMRPCTGIKQIRFVQTGFREYLLEINGSAESGILAACLDTQKDLLGRDAEIGVEYVSGIPVLASGKFRHVVQKAPQYMDTGRTGA